MRHLAMLTAAAVVLVGALAWADEEEKVPLDKLPKPVVEAVKKRFPKAELVSASKEDENGKVVFEVQIKDGDSTADVTVTPEGALVAIEKAIKAADLPKPVTEALDKKYAKATFKTVEEVIKFKDGKEQPAYFEVLLVTADKKTIEVELAADGKIIAEEEKKEKDEKGSDDSFTSDFSAEKPDLTHTGRNPYFILEPGYQITLADDKERVVITVLAETKMVDGVECRIVEERETKGDKLVEVSRNFFAISKRTNSVYYFGEEVDTYKDGKVTSHAGAWESGKDGAKFGLMMPGLPLLKAKFYQEVAPKVAMDRAEIVGLGLTVKTPAGEFKNCIKIEETTPLEKGKEYKLFAPGIGQVTEGDLKLVKHGKGDMPKK